MARSQVTLDSTPLERGNSESIAFYQHGAPLERGKLDLSYSTDMPIRWIGSNARVEALTHSLSSRLTLPRNRDSEITPTVNELLVERIIPTGIMARYQVTLLRELVIERKMSVAYSQIIVHHFNHSNHSSDNRATNFYQHVAPLGLGFFRNCGFLYTCGISIAVTIRSIDPRWG